MIEVMNDVKQKMAIAEQKAKELFATLVERGLIRPGKRESELIADVVNLAKELFGTESFWHKKIVRAGVNTMQPYSGNPPDLVIQEDDLVIVDFGPIFEGLEADLGRTYIMGNDPLKQKLLRDIEDAWHEAKAWHNAQSTLTGAEFFIYLHDLARKYGWEYVGDIGGHIVGPYPHEQLGDGNLGLDIHPGNHADILGKDPQGNDRHWILEIHFVDRAKGFGGFFEQMTGYR